MSVFVFINPDLFLGFDVGLGSGNYQMMGLKW